MILKVFSVYDTKTKSYSNPFYSPTPDSAIRAFVDITNNPKSDVNRHPSDYILHQIGEFDDSTGLLTPQTPVINLGIGSDYLKSMPGPDTIPTLDS